MQPTIPLSKTIWDLSEEEFNQLPDDLVVSGCYGQGFSCVTTVRDIKLRRELEKINRESLRTLFQQAIVLGTLTDKQIKALRDLGYDKAKPQEPQEGQEGQEEVS